MAQIFAELTSEESPQEAPMWKEAILGSAIDGLREDFEAQLQDGDFPEERARDIWNLYAAARKRGEDPLWVDDDHREVEPPPLEKLSEGDWSFIMEVIHDEFLWDRDWELGLFGGSNFALLSEQPHFPSIQEFRWAKTSLTVAYANCCQNQHSGGHKVSCGRS